MSELLAVALVCSSMIAVQDCSRTTALDVIVSPAHTPMECMIHGQTMAASTWSDDGEKRYVRVTCERRHADLRGLRRAGYAAAIVLVPRHAI
ncbi:MULTISPECIES: hypothetical protein [Methylobacterium]|jgi:hypothetical protein|uniref:Ribosomal protein S27 n=1 Tax=Methylobacterium bullatum TaxID=570505 RepID=A0A679JNT5_9HYPH|nr:MULTISPECIES: hypothetical protein [Methylobacterium]KQO54616.1 ribosomal protein S27 [Methylobacterium sp. Leaf85]KQP41740.1 ribosomal protein S27 [Methylobacterium sp. Leaf106]MBD8904311.1 hypothetical protein [Methylobacterium bullatum]TXN26997.1 hypothetical protein FV220_13095 [Methylobacterium sp. WL19]CAA2136465.1 hypothetical protein MBLL_00174 [Methylobacterium bullatum]